MVGADPTKQVLPADAAWLRRMRQAGLIAALSDRDWRTLSALLTFVDAAGRCRVPLDDMAAALGVERQETYNRLGDLAELRVHGEPLVRLLQDGDASSAEEAVILWLTNQVWERTGEAAEEHDLRPVYQFAEHVFNRPLANAEILAVRQWHQQYQFSREVIIELLEECYTKGKRRLSYMNAVARNWFDDGVRGVEDLRRRRQQDQEVMGRHSRIIHYLGLGRKLTQPEKDYLHKWTWEWGFSDEVIQRACDLTVNASRPSFAYIDKVLSGWRLHGVRTVDDAERVLAERESASRPYRSGRQGPARGTPPAAGTAAATASGASRAGTEAPLGSGAAASPAKPAKRGKYDHLILG